MLEKGIAEEVPEELLEYLKQDVGVFSALRTHAQLTEARSYLLDDNGKRTPYHQFEQKVLRLNETYNTNYLEAEWLYTQSSSQSVANWSGYSDNINRYALQYRTAGDDSVRASHRVLNGITLPKDDPFWLLYATPNGWRCRCKEVEVLISDYTLSDSSQAIEKGETATTHINKDGKNTLEMFRFNPALEKKIYPPKNSYTKVVGAKQVIKQIKNNETE